MFFFSNTKDQLFNTTTGRIRERKGKGTVRPQLKTAKQEDLRMWESLLCFDQAVWWLKIFRHIAHPTLNVTAIFCFLKRVSLLTPFISFWTISVQLWFKMFCQALTGSIGTVVFHPSLSERDIFSVRSAHVSRKEEQHCFCKQRNISHIPRGWEPGGHSAASHAEHALFKTCTERTQNVFRSEISQMIIRNCLFLLSWQSIPFLRGRVTCHTSDLTPIQSFLQN